MAIQINTSAFVRSHGTEPKGRGSWIFFLGEPNDNPRDTHTMRAPAYLTFREAGAWARKQVRRMGYQDATLHVAP